MTQMIMIYADLKKNLLNLHHLRAKRAKKAPYTS